MLKIYKATAMMMAAGLAGPGESVIASKVLGDCAADKLG